MTSTPNPALSEATPKATSSHDANDSLANDLKDSEFLDGHFPECGFADSNAIADVGDASMVITDIENVKIQDADIQIEEEDINPAKAKIYYPDSKITMASISDDVAIATAEDDNPENNSSNDSSNDSSEATTPKPLVSETSVTEDQKLHKPDHTDIVVAAIDQSILEQTDQFHDGLQTAENQTAQTVDEQTTDEQKIDSDNSDSHLEKENVETKSSDLTQADESTPVVSTTKPENLVNSKKNDKKSKKDRTDKENADEALKDKKEAKLESYKQFVAEQFNSQKVDYPKVRVTIEANALPSRMYFIMNILSAIIASYGLVTNSAAVVIGAMLVAMMLGPITGAALAIIDYRMPLLRKSLLTVLAGISLVVLVGFLIGLLHNDQPLTSEILSRTQPTSMDLMIALAGGTAGAYAMVSPHLSVAVVGVAVATALVPPLAASGILFAHNEITLGLGALLLAITNIIAIQFTNALVLWLLGFRRLVDDDYKSNTYLTFLRRNAVTLLLLAGLGTYLTINLQTNAKKQMFESSTKEAISSYFIDKGNVLINTQFNTSNENQVVRAVIRGETTPTSYDVRQIEAMISENMAENFPDYLPIKLQLRYLPVQVIESNPLITDKLDETDAAILTN